MAAKKEKPDSQGLSKEQVIAFLKEHPDFLQENAEVFEHLIPPVAHHGSNVVDLQHFMVGNLKKGLSQLKSRYEGLITSSRDNMSTLHQVHTAIVDLIKANDLERLLEVITLDLVHLFNVDVVRLAIESDAAEFYESTYSEQNYSGISFMEVGIADKAIGRDRMITLIEDVKKQFVFGFDQIFIDCTGLIRSCALIKLDLPSSERKVVLAFGVRDAGRFQQGQGTELLMFLGKVVEHRLDQELKETGIEQLI